MKWLGVSVRLPSRRAAARKRPPSATPLGRWNGTYLEGCRLPGPVEAVR